MIICSAVWHQDSLWVGKRHHDCIRAAAEHTQVIPVNGEQGFLTSDFIFLNRINAAEHALKCGQIATLKFNNKELFSEDLW